MLAHCRHRRSIRAGRGARGFFCAGLSIPGRHVRRTWSSRRRTRRSSAHAFTRAV